MRYLNPSQPEPLETVSEGREFIGLLAGVVGIVLASLSILLLASDYLTPHIPFSVEQSLASGIGERLFPANQEPPPANRAREDQLRQLTTRLLGHMDLPPGVSVQVHYVDSPTINAMATLGGHVFVFRGLLEKLQSEDALAAVLAHEIGHVKERHVLKAMGRGVMFVAGLSALGIKSQGLNRWALNKGGELTVLSYSREAEESADEAALQALYRSYGHVAGIDEVFGLFATLEPAGLAVTKSHPHSRERRARLLRIAQSLHMPSHGQKTPLKEGLKPAPRA
ncbi:MAG: M48 family metallopeptidase [Gammaproteobacteria bacterium]|nr:M48 family metallopeptidase [Gammaproteobacteria bacterium]